MQAAKRLLDTMKAVLSIWDSVSLFNMVAALSVGCLVSGRDSPAPNLDHGLAWLSTYLSKRLDSWSSTGSAARSGGTYFRPQGLAQCPRAHGPWSMYHDRNPIAGGLPCPGARPSVTGPIAVCQVVPHCGSLYRIVGWRLSVRLSSVTGPRSSVR